MYENGVVFTPREENEEDEWVSFDYYEKISKDDVKKYFQSIGELILMFCEFFSSIAAYCQIFHLPFPIWYITPSNFVRFYIYFI